jgi:two-component system OmpR family sensor kinase
MIATVEIAPSKRHDAARARLRWATIRGDVRMTLRLRLVLALAALLVVGLVLFGFATYSLYSRSEYQRLDDQIAASVELANRAFDSGANQGNPYDEGPGHGPTGPGQHPPANLPAGTYLEQRSATGAVTNRFSLIDSSSQPDLPATLTVPPGTHRFFSTGSVDGGEKWRVLVAADPSGDGTSTVIAAPLSGVESALHNLVLTESIVAAALLALLVLGSWLILRRGLHPLEQMSTTAGQITAGDLSQRVSPSGGPTEVGQLGLALNTMLDDIEEAFHERDETEQRLRQFLADASHELRTPITSIQGFAELFRVGAEHAEVDLPTILRRIEEESARMRVLVEDLLLLARLDETRPVESAPVDLAVLAADACSDAVASDRERPVTLDAPEPVVVLGDEDHLRQAIANLVTNALTHTPAGTPLEVRARRVDHAWAAVTVRDHGRGLDPAAEAHVFDRFWQADTARSGTGAGLGLAIVAGIAAEHGGAADARNAPGGGAEFTLRLPIAPAAATGTGTTVDA